MCQILLLLSTVAAPYHHFTQQTFSKQWYKQCSCYLLLLLGAELPLVVESFGLLNDIFPFPSILGSFSATLLLRQAIFG